jgi:hypothetical protein
LETLSTAFECDDPESLSDSLESIFDSIIESPTHQRALGRCGACALVTRVLEKYHTISESVCERALAAMSALCCSQGSMDACNTKVFGYVGGCKALSRTVQKFCSRRGSAKWGLNAIIGLVSDNDANKVLLANAGVCEGKRRESKMLILSVIIKSGCFV